MQVIQYGRRRFLTGMMTLAAAMHTSRLAIPIFAAEPQLPSQLAGLPYEMLVLGDSVVWGQGLPEEKKFYSIVRDKLQSEVLHRNIRLVMRALDKRQPQCLENHLNLQDQQTCEVAGTGHPNVKGAQKYADAIMDKLRHCMLPARSSS
jgi:lysophospholipase L1-like esterase